MDRRGKSYMTASSWNFNWSIDNNIFFNKLLRYTNLYYRKKIKEIFIKNSVSGNTILELGCGTGEDTIWMMNNFGFAKGTVVDFSDKALKKVKQNKGKLNIKLIKKDIFNLDLKEKFDLVHSGFVIEHFYGNDREKIIRKHAEYVTKNGFIFIQAPGNTPIAWLYSKTVNKLNGIDELLYSGEELIALLNKTRLKIIEFSSLFGGSVFFILAKKM